MGENILENAILSEDFHACEEDLRKSICRIDFHFIILEPIAYSLKTTSAL